MAPKVTARRSTRGRRSGSVAKFDFWGKIQKSSVGNSMTYRLPNSRKSNFATEPVILPPAQLPLGNFLVLVDVDWVRVHATLSCGGIVPLHAGEATLHRRRLALTRARRIRQCCHRDL